MRKRTKIVATIGPASRDRETLRSLFISGANVFRLNFSHGTPEEHAQVIATIRSISEELGVHVSVLQDLPGPKVRTGALADGATSVNLRAGSPFALTTENILGNDRRVSVNYKNLPEDVVPGKMIYLADGAIALRILSRTFTDIETTVDVGGTLFPMQGINYPEGSLNIESVTERDLEFLTFGLEHDVDWVAVSFVRSAHDVKRVKDAIAARNKSIPVLAKIEKHEALEDIADIISAADGIMVARGDLGI